MINKDAIWNKHWLTGLTAGTTYQYQMKTVCPGAPSGTPWSAVQSFTTPTQKMADVDGELFTQHNASIPLRMAPNPNNGQFGLQLGALGVDAQLQIIDPLGKVVYHRAVQAEEDVSERIDLSRHSKGIYFVRVAGNTINYTTRLVIQ